jgi:TatD DNase family protein
MNYFIDSHAHLTLDELWTDIDILLDRAAQANVKKVINICSSIKELKKILSYEHPLVTLKQAAAPSYVSEGEEEFKFFIKCVEEKRICALGEVGLDYYYNKDKESQKEFLKRYFELANEHNLSMVMHCREAFDDLFMLVDKYFNKDGKMVLHCFTGGMDEMKEAIHRGWYISFSGIITFKNADNLRMVAKETPIESMMIETDSPFLAPIPFRGKRNEPSFVVYVAEEIAKLKNVSLDILTKELFTSTENFLDY